MDGSFGLSDGGYRLEDRYDRPAGRVFMSGTQALVRLLLAQRDSDRRAGLDTAGFVSGYRGSPLAAYDLALWKARKHLASHDIVFQPGINEDLAATAVLGSQQVEASGEGTRQGVFGLWYGKGPGVDRAGDALRHGNAYGSSPHGGVLIVAGDDHGCVSSSMSHQSDGALISWSVPVLNPASVRDYLEFGLYGFALSRFSGAWVGFKAISETLESSGTVDLPDPGLRYVLPADFTAPPDGLHYRWPDYPHPRIEERLLAKQAAMRAFARANPLDRWVMGARDGWLRIVTAGKAHLDLMEALRQLGIDEAEARRRGIGVYKIGLTWPLETGALLAHLNGAETVLVVEEKAPVVEGQVKEALFHAAADRRPRAVIGKTDETGADLLPRAAELRPWRVAAVLAERLMRRFPEWNLADRLQALQPAAVVEPALDQRSPYFCSGCPHNSSTRVPDGSKAQAGIGCHFMASWMERSVEGLTQMGGEGVNWVGQAPFSKRGHIFQDLGEGTYYHSGSLAIRQAVAAGVNITYKILYNDAVAMTGGQPVDGPISVGAITCQMRAEGVGRIALVSDAPEKFDGARDLASGVTLHHRDEMDAVQRELRDLPGVTILIYEQTCAAEKRRRRKGGNFPDPARRLVINDLVCEGCGDCGQKSNCLSVQPLETEFGVKRQIDQASCNKDYSCAEGFCPSFVSVMGGSLRKPDARATGDRFAAALAALPVPAVLRPDGTQGDGTQGDGAQGDGARQGVAEILVAGIGGTGIVTVGAVVAMAAHLEGKAASVMDFMGFAQKGGAVYSHLRVAAQADQLHQSRVDPGQAHLLLACDMVVATAPDALRVIRPGATRVIANAHVVPTGDFTRHRDRLPDGGALVGQLRRRAGARQVDLVDADRFATELLGDSIMANIFMLGFATQQGLIPVGLAALEQAITLNGVAIPANLRAFALGRLAAHDPTALATALAPAARPAETLAAIVERRADFLMGYQDAAYAERYRQLVTRVEAVETARLGQAGELTKAVAKSYFKLLAYKDEYEVARLHADPAFRKQLEGQFEGDWKPVFHLAPPLLARARNGWGEPKKIAFGAWILPAFRILAGLRRLRGTRLDPFGYLGERRTERALITEYEALVETLLAGFGQANRVAAIALAALPMDIRGYGPVKHRAIEAYRTRKASLLAQWQAGGSAAAA